MPLSAEKRTALLTAARNAHACAHAPYSNFRVGAAVWTYDDRLFIGCNIENASYGLGICAERVAIFNAISAGSHRIKSVAVTCPDAKDASANNRMPCGACRQVMSEFGGPSLIVLVDGVGEFTLEDLHPHPFTLTADPPIK